MAKYNEIVCIEERLAKWWESDRALWTHQSVREWMRQREPRAGDDAAIVTTHRLATKALANAAAGLSDEATPWLHGYALHIKPGRRLATAETRRFQAWTLVRTIAALAKTKSTKATNARRRHANGTLDERALATAKRLQKDPATRDKWGPDDVATQVKSHRASLLGMKNRKRRCPLFFEYWYSVQQQRASEKDQRKRAQSAKAQATTSSV